MATVPKSGAVWQNTIACQANFTLTTTRNGKRQIFEATCDIASQFLKTLGDSSNHSRYSTSVKQPLLTPQYMITDEPFHYPKYIVSPLNLSKGSEKYTENDITPLKAAATIDLFLHGGSQMMPKDPPLPPAPVKPPEPKGWFG